uniref:ABC1 atypical kinase-like domain-containing protein n=1 Tax=Zea mays TaxID=4577 RepID=A0A804Q6W9_MAIZE
MAGRDVSLNQEAVIPPLQAIFILFSLFSPHGSSPFEVQEQGAPYPWRSALASLCLVHGASPQPPMEMQAPLSTASSISTPSPQAAPWTPPALCARSPHGLTFVVHVLDRVVVEAGRHGVRLILSLANSLSLVNNLEAHGGKTQYVLRLSNAANGLQHALICFHVTFCTELSKLHTKAPAHSFTYTKKTVEKAFGQKLSDIFEEDPVASGSVAQVHRAVLRFRYPNRQTNHVTVAVKVRHPGVGDSIKRDFNIINAIAKITRYIPTLNWLRLDESVQQFAVFMMSEVDLAREAAHLSRFILNFRRWKDVSFPRPLYPLVHPAVLVETYEHGESVSRYVDDLEGHDRIKSALAHIGTHVLLKMLLMERICENTVSVEL